MVGLCSWPMIYGSNPGSQSWWQSQSGDLRWPLCVTCRGHSDYNSTMQRIWSIHLTGETIYLTSYSSFTNGGLILMVRFMEKKYLGGANFERLPLQVKSGKAFLKEYYLKNGALREPDLDELVAKSGMSYEQVRHWFTETARRAAEGGAAIFSEEEDEEEEEELEEEEEELEEEAAGAAEHSDGAMEAKEQGEEATEEDMEELEEEEEEEEEALKEDKAMQEESAAVGQSKPEEET